MRSNIKSLSQQGTDALWFLRSLTPFKIGSKFILVTITLSVFFLALPPSGNTAQPTGDSTDESKFITSVRQLTLEGRRAGEGYFNADGSKLIFQSERVEGNPFFQMFVLDLETGDTTQVSPGLGKTTCGWFHPDNRTVMFASTQHDPQAQAKQVEELKLRETGQQRRYEWDYDEAYEIYACDLPTKDYTRLTNALGYDAEGSYSPDGKLIAFSSNRNAYSNDLTAEQAALFEKDKSFMMDIYIMNADGTDVRQLTDVPGYDGGPFFSPDGQRICWRRFDEQGLTAEIMTMNIDGSDQRQLTNMRQASFAPFYHPSGKYLIFNNNKQGFANFELYLVDVEGQSPPVRVTTADGFDGLASFSPDGKQIYWTSTRHDTAARKGQIFRADWNHQYALKALGLDESSADEAAAKKVGAEAATATTVDFDARDIVRHVDYLCRKELGGRMTGTSGERKATAYVAAYLDNLGIKPDGDDGSWFQEFEFPDGADLGPGNQLLARNSSGADESTSTYELQKDWQPLTYSSSGPLEESSIVFVGYGISADSQENQPAYDSYGTLDVEGKWVLMFRYSPDEVDDERRQFLHYHSSLRKKTMVARDRGARGIIVVSGPNSNVRQQLVPLENDFSEAGSSVAAISITDDIASAWLKHAGQDLKQLQDSLDTGEQAAAFEIPDVRLTGAIDVSQRTGTGRNVVGRLQVSDVPSEQAILIGAHIDHLGRGTGGSLARNEEKNQIHFGADDNASGVAAMLEVAEYLAGLKRQNKLDLKRDVIFAAWSGEELGLHGSQHFVKQRIKNFVGTDQKTEVAGDGTYQGDPHDLDQLLGYYERLLDGFDAGKFTIAELELLKSNTGDMRVVTKLLSSPVANDAGQNGNKDHVQRIDDLLKKANDLIKLADAKIADGPLAVEGTAATTEKKTETNQPIIACLNMDMVGRMQKQLVLQGLGSSEDWNRLIEKANVVVGLPIKLSDDTQLPTDASSFYRAGVPILSAFTGSHTDYHTPRDTPEKLNYPAASQIAHLMGLITRSLATADESPAYRKHTVAPKSQVASSGRRARLGSVPNYTEKVNGVLLDDVATDSPADAAGLQGGDIITELDGRKIENIYDYQYAIDSLKVGKEINITILRANQTLKLKITPGSRD